ncbi:MAG: APC family permease [Elusimicrobiota bacterium]
MESEGKRALNLFDLSCIGINAIVGSGVFLFPGLLAGFLGPASIIAFGFTGLLLISVGLCYAEASSHFQKTGGSYLYAGEAFGPQVGYGIGWMAWATQIFSWAAVANAIALYLGFFHPALGGFWATKSIAIIVIAGLSAVNYRGVKLGAWTSDFFTAAKLIPLGLFVILGLPRIHMSFYHPFAPHGWKPLGKACFLAYFAFQGFESVPVPAGETKNPRRNVPLAVIISLSFSALLYMAVQSVAIGLNPNLAGSSRPLADAAALGLGSIWAGIMVLATVFSTTGYNAGSALVTPRYLSPLAEDGHLPPVLAKIHPKFETPAHAIILTAVLTITLAAFLDFDKLVDFSNVVVCAQYVATCAAVPFLRRKKTEGAVWRLPGGPLIPILGVMTTLWLGSQGGIQQIWWSLAILVFGYVLKAAWPRFLPKTA